MALFAQPLAAGLSSVSLELAGKSIDLEIADNDAERSAGLSNRETLPEGTGMLFVYPRPHTPCFWMRDTLIPLDAGFIDDSGKIVMVATMEPQSLDLHCTERPVKWVIEMPAGWFASNGLELGSKVGRKALAKLRGISVAAGLR